MATDTKARLKAQSEAAATAPLDARSACARRIELRTVEGASHRRLERRRAPRGRRR